MTSNTSTAERAASPPRGFTMRRSIVIGIGGTGRHVCTHLKRILLETNDNDRGRFPHVCFLSIDTDIRVRGVEDRSGDLVQLDPSEMLGLRIPPLFNRDRFRNFMSDRVSSFLPHANEKGAMRCRPIGHAFLVTNWRVIKDRLRAIYSDLENADMRELVRTDQRFQGRSLDSRQTDIYVIGNLVSGTGSGMALGMGYLLRDLLFELGREGEDHIEGIFTTCGMFALADVAGQPSPYAVNCYASLLELNHYSSPSIHKNLITAFNPGFDEVILAGKVRQKPPYDHVQLLNPSHSAAGNLETERFEPQIAEVLALRTGSIVGMTASAKIIDEWVTRDQYDRHGNQRFCWAWGAKSFRSSGQDILDLAVALTSDEILDALTGENVRSAMNRKNVAYDVLTSIGFGYAVEDEPSRKQNTGLLTSLLTPSEPVEGGAKGVSLLDSIKDLIHKAFPTPPEDREFIRGLPVQIDLRKQGLSVRISGLIAAVVEQNRRVLALRAREAVAKQIEDLSDFSLDGRGSLDDAIGVLDLLVGMENDLGAGMLRRDSEQYQAGAQLAMVEAERARALTESSEQSVRSIAAMGGKFEYEALVGAWNNFVTGLIQQKQGEARQAVLGEARKILDGDAADRDETLRFGLIRYLEQMRLRLRGARQQLKALDVFFERKIENLNERLTRFEASNDSSVREARVMKDRVLDGELLRLCAVDIVEKVVGRPCLAGSRYKDPAAMQQDYAGIDRVVRAKVQAIGVDRLSRSIEDNPNFGGRLIGYLESAEPAINLDVNLEGDMKGIAYISVPAGLPIFRRTLLENQWLEDRTGNKPPEELIEERPGDGDPRIDVITAKLTFSPAAVVGVDKWAERYERAAATAGGRREIHIVADSSGGKGLVFEPLGATEARFQLAYLIARSMEWLRPTGAGSVYLYVNQESQFSEDEETRGISLRLGDPDFFTELRNPLVVGSNDPNQKLPIFLHVLLRFQSLMSRDDNDEERNTLFGRLVIGLAQLVKKTGVLKDDPLLPKPADKSQFLHFEHALRCLLLPLGVFEDLNRQVKALVKERVPALGEVHNLRGAPPSSAVHAPPPPAAIELPLTLTEVVPLEQSQAGPRLCPNNHRVAEGYSFCGACGVPVPESGNFCTKGHEVPMGNSFCGKCGSPVFIATGSL